MTGGSKSIAPSFACVGRGSGTMPWVRRWRFAFERTVNVLLQSGTGHGKAVREGKGQKIVQLSR